MNYYYLKNGETLVPLPIDDLVKIIDENTMVWCEDGSTESNQISNRYFFQKWKHYTKMKPDKDGNPTGTMVNFSGGI